MTPVLSTMWSGAGDLESLGYLRFGLMLWLIIPLGTGIVIAVFSRRVARWILPGADDAALESPSAPFVQSVAIGTFGLFLIAVDLPGMVAGALTLSARNEALHQSVALSGDPLFLGKLLSVAMGVFLLTGAAFWSRLITMFRRAGGAPA